MIPSRTKPPKDSTSRVRAEPSPAAAATPAQPAPIGSPPRLGSPDPASPTRRRIRAAEPAAVAVTEAAAARRQVRFDLPDAEQATRQLRHLGYTRLQIDDMNPEARQAVATHHASLAARGFDPHMLAGISRWHRTLPFLVLHAPDFQRRLPALGPAELSLIAQTREGIASLKALLELAEPLKAPPLQLGDTQLFEVARQGASPALRALHALGNSLVGAPLRLAPNDVVTIACRGGAKALVAVHELTAHLHDAGLTAGQIVSAAASPRAKVALQAAVHAELALRDGHPALSAHAWLPAQPSIEDLCDPLMEPGGLFDPAGASGAAAPETPSRKGAAP
jgi:hypothetical protein